MLWNLIKESNSMAQKNKWERKTDKLDFIKIKNFDDR